MTRSFTDRRKTSEGIRGQMGKRNAPTTMNAALLGNQFWDGRASRVEDQAASRRKTATSKRWPPEL